MNQISLKKVTLIVSVWALASYFVSAEEKVTNLDTSTTKAVSTKTVSAKAASTNSLTMPMNDISALLTKFDSDKNGSLSKTEVVESKSELLTKHFKSIDQNEDAAISKDELNTYFLL